MKRLIIFIAPLGFIEISHEFFIPPDALYFNRNSPQFYSFWLRWKLKQFLVKKYKFNSTSKGFLLSLTLGTKLILSPSRKKKTLRIGKKGETLHDSILMDFILH